MTLIEKTTYNSGYGPYGYRNMAAGRNVFRVAMVLSGLLIGTWLLVVTWSWAQKPRGDEDWIVPDLPTNGSIPWRGVTGPEAGETPQFVLDYAPYVWLHSTEDFLPSHLATHLEYIHPRQNYTRIYKSPNLTSLADLNPYNPTVYLTSIPDPSQRPSYLLGAPPDPSTNTTDSPIVILHTQKSPEITDAFYFFFYSFNLGNTVAGIRFGNHVGDWEHTMIRFINGEPKYMFFSQHERGAAYSYEAVEKMNGRPVVYSARGSHANYATAGVHYYAIPFHLLSDRTDQGKLWDVRENAWVYRYDPVEEKLVGDIRTGENGETEVLPTEWFDFEGRWGDMAYPRGDKRQYEVVGQMHWVDGPTGPKDKNLGRRGVCQNEDACDVKATRYLDGEGLPVMVMGEDGVLRSWFTNEEMKEEVEL